MIANTKRNILFVMAISIILSTTLLTWLFTEFADGVSSPKNSILEGRTYATLPQNNYRNMLMNGEFQNQFEQFISDKTPDKDRVLLLNAATQRHIIEAANIPYNFDAYPTFFGSDRVYCPSVDAVYREPADSELYPDEFFAKPKYFFEQIIGKSADDINWVYYLPESSEIAEGSPAHSLVSEPIDYSCVKERFTELLGNDATFIENNYTEPAEYADKLYRFDHHFQSEGARDFYSSACAALGRTPLMLDESYIPYEGNFIGSNARAGLYVEGRETISDIRFDLGNTHVLADGSEVDPSKISKQYLTGAQYKQTSPYENVYASWFSDSSLIEYVNDDLPDSTGSLLIISDSYDDNSSRFFSANWHHVYDIAPRSFSGGIPAIQEFIASHPDIHDGVMIISMDVYYQMEKAGVL